MNAASTGPMRPVTATFIRRCTVSTAYLVASLYTPSRGPGSSRTSAMRSWYALTTSPESPGPSPPGGTGGSTTGAGCSSARLAAGSSVVVVVAVVLGALVVETTVLVATLAVGSSPPDRPAAPLPARTPTTTAPASPASTNAATRGDLSTAQIGRAEWAVGPWERPEVALLPARIPVHPAHTARTQNCYTL